MTMLVWKLQLLRMLWMFGLDSWILYTRILIAELRVKLMGLNMQGVVMEEWNFDAFVGAGRDME